MADWDFIIVGSGFGGSVSALRLVERSYKVLLLEKGKRLGPDDFPKTNWDLKRWLWRPALGFHGKAMTLVTETRGGACMGDSPETGVIDHRHRAFGYEGLYVIDGSAVSANPGVNPALTIAALAERAMTFIPPKQAGRPC